MVYSCKIFTLSWIIRKQTEKSGLCDIIQENVSAIIEKRKIGKYSGLKKTEGPWQPQTMHCPWLDPGLGKKQLQKMFQGQLEKLEDGSDITTKSNFMVKMMVLYLCKSMCS